ncbi:hypothetical protein Ae201684P_008407 [Aphanomyces euteiches]|uniref:Major facilitator superfamily (MFS) profile domain-containing protein n=1 Tax=Aphanomyces euteiches TaxID=100861 RepID=A0A6G0XP45_9STRA|nr:hypothetical protein Ae201684_002960 [Aphanomyces euteiches]KAH9092738.1 hypothetical protein Ae201684P_008407 [Aphanomyces euteiches]
MRTDRLSIESGVEFVDDAYASVMTPDVADGGTSLRPTDRPVSIYNVKNLGLAAHIAGVGVVYGTLTGVIYAVLNNYLHMSTTLVATATALVTFPRSLGVFTGMLTDRVPIFGYRRRPYLILGWLLSFVSCLLMALFLLGDPYYRDPALSKIAATKLTAAQKAAGINLDAPQHGIKLIVLLAFAHLGVIVAFCGYHGVLVNLSQREPEHLRGTALGELAVVHYLFAVISSFMTGVGLNSPAYGGSFSWTIGFSAIMWICAAASLLTIPFSIWCIQEPKITTFFFYNVLTAVSVTSDNAIQSDWAGVEPLTSGIASMLTALLTVVGSWYSKKHGLSWNWRTVVITCQVGVVFIDAWPKFLTIWNVVRNQWLWLGVLLLEKIPEAVVTFITGLFVFELMDCQGYEATMMGLALTSQQVEQPFATVLTKTIDGYFNIDRAQIKADTPHVRTQVTWMYSIMYVVNLASLAFVVFLPTREKDATARDGSYEQEESLLGHVDHRLLALFVGVDAHDKHIEPLDLDQLSPHCWWQRLLGNT